MTKRYTNNYHILGIRPGVTWQELRQAYKSLVNIWHPDRFQQDIRQRKLAEEKTKEITQSYKELAEYYKKFGALPPITETAKVPVTEDIAPQDTPAAHPAPESQDTELSATVTKPVEAHKSKRFRLPSAMAAAAIAGAIYLVLQIVLSERSNDQPQNENRLEQAADNKTDMDEDPDHRTSGDGKYFTFGMSLGEVYAIQGVPTKTEHDIWYYGGSKVYFVQGKVQHWEESPDNPLRTSIKPGGEKMRAEFFGKGSSKKEVLAVQGAPERDAGNVWDYGVSRVYFDHDRVKSWDESPLHPLRVRQ
jgi:hypothetical protein